MQSSTPKIRDRRSNSQTVDPAPRRREDWYSVAVSDDAPTILPHSSLLLAELAKHLARKDRSTAELRSRLARAGHTPEAIDDALAAARERGWIDDSRFAREAVLSAAGRGRGRTRIVAQLVSRGLSRGEAEAAWDRAVATGEIDPEAALTRALARFQPRGGGASDRRRLYNSLLRAGFETDRILEVLGGHDSARDEDETE